MFRITPTNARLLALVVTVLWSSSWVFIRLGLDDADLQPITFAGLRYALAGVVLAAWVIVRRERTSTDATARRDTGIWRWLLPLVGLGVVQYAVTQGSQFVAIDNQPAATTTLLLAATPLLVAFCGAFVHEPPTPRHFIAAGIVLVGTAIYFAGDLGATPIGMIAAIITLVGNAASVLIGRVVNRQRRWRSQVITLVSMSSGAVILLTVGLTVEGLPRLSAVAAVIIVWLAVVNTAVAFTWWNVSLRELPAMEMAALNNAMGIQIPLLGWVFLDESLGPAELFGLALTALGVWFATVWKRPETARTQPSSVDPQAVTYTLPDMPGGRDA